MGARILLATGHEILRSGLEPRLLREPDIESVALASTGDEALRVLAQTSLDVAVIEADLPGLSSVEVIERAKDARTKVRCVALVSRYDRSELDAIMRAGTSGIVSTFSPARALVKAVVCVHRGHCYVSEDVTSALVSGVCGVGGAKMTSSHEAAGLSVREREVLRLVAEDCSSREISQRLGISPRTVETHRAHLMDKLQVHKTAALVRIAVREGLVAPESPGMSPAPRSCK